MITRHRGLNMSNVALRLAAIAAAVLLTFPLAAQEPRPRELPPRYDFSARASAQTSRSEAAQNRSASQHEPGRFDFYVLALSWSPSFCEAAAERAPDRVPREQCGARPYSFVVHGLWPQYERGFPRDCQVPAPRLPREIVNSMLDLMPSPRLVFNQWDRHGTCSGLPAQSYFELVRRARAQIQVPKQFTELKAPLTVKPDEVESAFVAANPGLTAGSIAVTCDHRRLSEVRVCMSKDLLFRDCPEVRRRACPIQQVVMPPLRGG
jgi:ribonuclease T2